MKSVKILKIDFHEWKQKKLQKIQMLYHFKCFSLKMTDSNLAQTPVALETILNFSVYQIPLLTGMYKENSS